MRLEDVLPALRAGNKIRRQWWSKGLVVIKKKDALLLRDTINKRPRHLEAAELNDEDILARDWEVVK